jgi:AmiR/NasT family two-component response regulator
VAVSGGVQLVELCRASPPDLFLTDVRRPALDGVNAAAAASRGGETPMILITAHPGAETLEWVVSQPVMTYLMKPVDPADVEVAVTIAVRRSREFGEARREAAVLRQALKDRKEVERAKSALIKWLRVGEDAAYRNLRRYASDRNLQLVQAARAALGAEAAFGELNRAGGRGATCSPPTSAGRGWSGPWHRPGGLGMVAPRRGEGAGQPGLAPAVLVVEDDETLRFALKSLLVGQGYWVLTAATGRDALGTMPAPPAPPAAATIPPPGREGAGGRVDAPRTLAASFVAAAAGAFGFGLLLGLEVAGVRLGPWGAAAACLACGGLAVGGAWALPCRRAGGARRTAQRALTWDALAARRAPPARPAVAVLDIGLPDASGVELCARLRERHPGLPVIVCTGEAGPEDAARLLRLGVGRYFVKPVSPDELLASVAAACR